MVQNSVKEIFTEKLLAMARDLKLGDPMKADTQVGPIATPPQYEKVLHYIGVATDPVKAGAGIAMHRRIAAHRGVVGKRAARRSRIGHAESVDVAHGGYLHFPFEAW